MTGTGTLFDLPQENCEPASEAVFSDDRAYRYVLARRWSSELPLPWIAHNPSTANADRDDPTSRRFEGFSRRLGYGGYMVMNLYAAVSTDRHALLTIPDPVGPDNDGWLASLGMYAAFHGLPIIAAWGTHKSITPQRVRHVAGIAGIGDRLRALQVTKGGAPAHPLYLAGSLTPIPYTIR